MSQVIPSIAMPDKQGDDHPKSSKKNRLDYLDGLRGLAALMVVTHHGMLKFDFAIYSSQPADSHFGWDIKLSGLPFFLPNAGNFAVCIFFVLSGFVLSRSFSRTDLAPIASGIKRYIRLVVPITAANLLSLAVGICAIMIPTMAAFIPPLALMHDGSGRAVSDMLPATGFCLYEALYKSIITGPGVTTFNGVLWSMPIEFQGSLILILIQALSRLATSSKRRREIWAAVWAFIFFVFTWNSYLGLFGAGALLYSAVNFGVLQSTRRYAMLQYGLLISALFFGTMPFGVARILFYNAFIFVTGTTFQSLAVKTVYHPVLVLLGVKDWVPFAADPVALWHCIGATLLLGCLCLSAPLQYCLSTAPCRFLGKISFPLYLVHANVLDLVATSTMQFALRHHLSYGAGMILAISAFVPASLVVAYLFGLAVEDRSIRWSHQVASWIHRRLMRRPALTFGLGRPVTTP